MRYLSIQCIKIKNVLMYYFYVGTLTKLRYTIFKLLFVIMNVCVHKYRDDKR